jgi:DNA-binding transcriptional ArsR family regulator
MSKSTYYIFFRNLANPLRIKIIEKLKEKENSVGELSKKLKVEQSKISHALSSLKNCRIVEVKQKGKQRIYFLNKKTILPILKILDKHKCEKCGYCN